jgi:dipeptidase E
MNRKLLLISSSRTHGTGYLEHCRQAITRHLGSISKVLFVPYALRDHDSYATTVRQAFHVMGKSVDSLHQADSPLSAIRHAEAFFVGGGNTFRLLKTLQDMGIMPAIRKKVLEGTPYIGSSAGTNIAAPSISTANDMPIVWPDSPAALNLVRFQINPHFLDADPDSPHQGETREQRLREFHEENLAPVVAIREGSWLEVTANSCLLGGERGGVLFRPSHEPLSIDKGADLDQLIEV